MDFFSKEDLDLLSKWAGIDYNANIPVHEAAGDKLSNGLYEKTKFWCESVAEEVNMTAKVRKTWLKRGGERGFRFRPYAWGRIYDSSTPLSEIYFTVGIDGSEEPYLQYKIDYHFETPEELNKKQQELAKTLTRNESGYRYHKVISLEDLDNYDWASLISETANFIYDHEMIYRDIVNAVFNERKNFFTRICWNTNGWVEPSGPKGKSTSKNTFEGLTGFGIDEWLFSDHLKVGKYQYGYLEAKNLSSKESPVDIDLFTLEKTPTGMSPYYVAHLKNVEILDRNTVSKFQEEQNFRNEVLTRIERLKNSDEIKDKFSTLFEDTFINIRFKVTDVSYPDTDQLPEINLDTNRFHRYELYNGALDAAGFWGDNNIELSDTGRSQSSPNTSTGTRTPGSYEITHWHAQISKQLEKYLKTIKSDGDTVIPERVLGRRSVDLVHEKKDEIVYYEIKTQDVRKGIRAAIGQLLEYAYWKRREHKKEPKLVIVTPNEADRFTRNYMTMLKERFKLPIYYQQFDLDIGELKEEI